ncbi:MAG: hypothetical protein IT437_07475 [Phycisphaerales bacterium]|nr:hypothetical protein [Phycisphaerales bacterium]
MRTGLSRVTARPPARVNPARALLLCAAAMALGGPACGQEASSYVPIVVPAGAPATACDLTQVVVPPGMNLPTTPRAGYPQIAQGSIPGDPLPLGHIIDAPPSNVSDAYRWITVLHEQYIAARDPLPTGHNFRSCCWSSLVMNNLSGEAASIVQLDHMRPGFAEGMTFPRGFRMNVSLLATPSIGDHLPASPTIGGSSAALVPPGAGSAPTGWNGSNRPVLGGTVDLVTGLPLVQVTDLELPLGGATFRLLRTRSARHGLDRIEIGQWGSTEPEVAAVDKWWDWTGVGWMASENPILLIDSALPDLVGPNPRVTWLVLDAHHAIPFQQVNLAQGPGGEPRVGYEAPPRFRARLKHNGVWAKIPQPWGDTYGWSTPPTQYEVWLYDGAIKYTFVAVREDVPMKSFDTTQGAAQDPEWTWTSYHDTALYPPVGTAPEWYDGPYESDRNPGFAIPYYGLCTKIEDSYGHAANIHYVPTTRARIDAENTTCTACQQLCLRKGQISYITLDTPSGTEWTLVYAHRFFQGPYPDSGQVWNPPDAHPALLGASAIDRIYVYKGPLFGGIQIAEAPVLEIDTDNRPDIDPVDPLAVYNTGHSPALPTTWVHQVRYHYRNAAWDTYGGSSLHGVQFYPPMLAWTEVTSRKQDTQGHGLEAGPPAVRNTFYRYDTSTASGQEVLESPYLQRVFTHDDFNRLIRWAVEHLGPGDTAEESLARWVSHQTPFHFSVADYTFEYPDWSESELNQHPGARELLDGFASVRLGAAQEEGQTWEDGRSDCPSPASILTTYVKSIERPECLVDDISGQAARLLSVHGPDGLRRHFRVRRLVYLGEGAAKPLNNTPFHLSWVAYDHGLPASATLVDFPRRSVLVHPYRWRTYFFDPGTRQVTYHPGGEPAEARWISIIDEFRSWAEMTALTPYSRDTVSTKPGQLSRRVVEVNASGYVLRDATWEFTPEGTIRSGGGLGDQYIYKKLRTVLPEAEADLMALVSASTPPPPPPATPPDPEPDKRRQIEAYLDQVLLVEHRSVGWSAAEKAGTGNTEGLIEFNEYKWFDIAQEDGNAAPWQARAQRVATGVKRGVSGPGYYTHQIVRNPDTPTDVLEEIEFLSPQEALLQTVPSAETDTGTYKITRYTTAREAPAQGTETPTTERRITSRQRTGPPRKLRPDAGAPNYFPVELQSYDDEGRTVWSAAGLVTDPGTPPHLLPVRRRRAEEHLLPERPPLVAHLAVHRPGAGAAPRPQRPGPVRRTGRRVRPVDRPALHGFALRPRVHLQRPGMERPRRRRGRVEGHVPRRGPRLQRPAAGGHPPPHPARRVRHGPGDRSRDPRGVHQRPGAAGTALVPRDRGQATAPGPVRPPDRSGTLRTQRGRPHGSRGHEAGQRPGRGLPRARHGRHNHPHHPQHPGPEPAQVHRHP